MSSHASSSAFEILLRPFPVAVVTIKQAHVPLAALAVLQLLDDLRTQADGFFSLYVVSLAFDVLCLARLPCLDGWAVWTVTRRTERQCPRPRLASPPPER
jgi:hypothetical protein